MAGPERRLAGADRKLVLTVRTGAKGKRLLVTQVSTVRTGAKGKRLSVTQVQSIAGVSRPAGDAPKRKGFL
eukprot:4702746-Pyramimonas_sp.AAC.1